MTVPEDDKKITTNPLGTPLREPSIDALQRDIALANQYRLELIKLLMTLSAGILAFTVSFRPSLRDVQNGWLMWAGWIGLGVSMVGGMIHMLGWDRFYVSYRDYDITPLTQVTPYPPSPRPSGLAVATDAQLHARRSIL